MARKLATLAQQASCSHLLWVISRAAFRAIALRSSHRELLLALKRVPILLGLSDVRLGRLAETLSEVRFAFCGSDDVVPTSLCGDLIDGLLVLFCFSFSFFY